MKRFFEYVGLGAIILFSFFYTEKAALLVQNKNPIMQKIHREKENLSYSAVNATIDGDYIIPGKNGLEVDAEKSFQKMKAVGAFNEYFLTYQQVYPQISLEKNKDKIIQKGNIENKSISIVLADASSDIATYLKENKLKASILTTKDSFEENSYFEQLNYEENRSDFYDLDADISKRSSKKICVLQEQNKELCKKHGYYLVEKNIELNSSNLIDVKSKVSRGSIIFIQENAKLSDFQIIHKEIKYKGLEMVFLSELISEENTALEKD